MKIGLKFLQLLIDLATWFKNSRNRARIRREIQNEGAMARSKKLAKAYETLRHFDADGDKPNKLRKDDGHRRD